MLVVHMGQVTSIASVAPVSELLPVHFDIIKCSWLFKASTGSRMYFTLHMAKTDHIACKSFTRKRDGRE